MAEEEKKPEEIPRPEWGYKEEFGIVTKLREAIQLTKGATEKELEGLRRKLDRLTYGS
jgi:hypothetical protein